MDYKIRKAEKITSMLYTVEINNLMKQIVKYDRKSERL